MIKKTSITEEFPFEYLTTYLSQNDLIYRSFSRKKTERNAAYQYTFFFGQIKGGKGAQTEDDSYILKSPFLKGSTHGILSVL